MFIRTPIPMNQAGTAWPRSPAAMQAMAEFDQLGPLSWSPYFSGAMDRIAAHFGCANADRWLPTPSCTGALAVLLSDLDWQAGDRLLISAFEHHAVSGAAARLAARGVQVVVVPPDGTAPVDVDALEGELRLGARLVCMTGASNVTGALLPLDWIADRCGHHGVPLAVDGAQIAGWLPMRAEAWSALAVAGHKGLRGPWGIGLLHVREDLVLSSPAATCALPEDGSPPECATMPGYCDVGSTHQRALVGLAAAVTDLDALALDQRLSRGRGLAELLQQGIASAGGRILGPLALSHRLPTVAWTQPGLPAQEVARRLAERGVHVGAGFHCAPLAHEALGTSEHGCLRVSVGPQTTMEQVQGALDALSSALS